MSTTEREQYLHRLLCTDQTEIYKSKYLDPFGLFVSEKKGSEIEVIVSNRSIGYETEHLQNSPTSSTTLTEPLTNFASTRQEGCDIPGYDHRVLRDDSEIDLVCNEADHGFRMFHIKHTEHSRSRLHVTRTCFEQLIQSVGVFSAVKDIILHMGYREAEVEIAPPSLRAGYLFDKSTSENGVCGHEISYGLRYIQRNGRSSGKPWSLRQFFIYNKSLIREETSQWLMFCMPEEIRAQVDDYLEAAQQETISRSFDIHSLLCSAVIRMWRPYFIDLSEQIEAHRRRVERADLTDEDTVQKLGTSTLSTLKTIELDALDALLALRATKDTLKRIKIVHNVVQDTGILDDCIKNQHGLDIINSATSNGLRDLDMLIEQATSLSQKAQGLSALHASFLNLANGFSLQTLAKQQEQDGREMKKLTKMATRDTKAVKALSIITLIYLPITVVFNFFSTSFVDKGDNGVQLIGHWWLLFAIGLPLTVLTLFVWMVCVLRNHKYEDKQSSPRGMEKLNSESIEEESVETCSEKSGVGR